ncbi:group XV phospholipase A2 [Eurytemora carolleeae]|uniref:group XV phospholipase A2 n=1 Tax=Eurytemora carolleeae TaxID=1294199 RepID=UPI000C77D069|nr:group XV phospholipase A2 [Eurytemora carolleeae]|eukprot:XP_023333809.1 group XV phospholipase A2-like [Eurytemora affinis]
MLIRDLICLLCLIIYQVDGTFHPVIMIPGDGGSQVEGRIVNKTNVPHYLCSKNSDWFTLWLSLEQMVPEVVDCWVDNMRLKYDPITRKSSNNDGVEIRIPNFGNTSSVEHLDPSMQYFTGYFANIADHLVQAGYTRGVNLHGAPYDFRKAANELEDFFVKVKDLIEGTYKANNNLSVILLTHSMGSPMMLYFLLQQSQGWKDKYIRSMVTLAGPWGGTVRALKVFAVGDNLGAWLLNEKKLMWEQRTSPSLAWLMPQIGFWDTTEVLVETAEKNYTMNDYQEFFTDLKEPNAWFMRLDTKDLIAGLPAPNVEVFCLHGSGVDTTEKLIYKKGEFPGSDPSTILKGNGDGTVNYRSLIGCTRWADQQKQRVTHHEFPGVDHLQILREEEPAAFISNLITSINRRTKMKLWNYIRRGYQTLSMWGREHFNSQESSAVQNQKYQRNQESHERHESMENYGNTDNQDSFENKENHEIKNNLENNKNQDNHKNLEVEKNHSRYFIESKDNQESKGSLEDDETYEIFPKIEVISKN